MRQFGLVFMFAVSLATVLTVPASVQGQQPLPSTDLKTEIISVKAGDAAETARMIDEMYNGSGADRRIRVAVCVEFPTKSGHRVNGYSACSYSAGETYPSEEWRRWPL